MNPLRLVSVACVLRDGTRLHRVVLEGPRLLSSLEGVACTYCGTLGILLLVRMVIGAIRDVVQDVSHAAWVSS